MCVVVRDRHSFQIRHLATNPSRVAVMPTRPGGPPDGSQCPMQESQVIQEPSSLSPSPVTTGAGVGTAAAITVGTAAAEEMLSYLEEGEEHRLRVIAEIRFLAVSWKTISNVNRRGFRVYLLLLPSIE